jgi:hypothetical protein
MQKREDLKLLDFIELCFLDVVIDTAHDIHYIQNICMLG